MLLLMLMQLPLENCLLLLLLEHKHNSSKKCGLARVNVDRRELRQKQQQQPPMLNLQLICLRVRANEQASVCVLMATAHSLAVHLYCRLLLHHNFFFA